MIATRGSNSAGANWAQARISSIACAPRASAASSPVSRAWASSVRPWKKTNSTSCCCARNAPRTRSA